MQCKLCQHALKADVFRNGLCRFCNRLTIRDRRHEAGLLDELLRCESCGESKPACRQFFAFSPKNGTRLAQPCSDCLENRRCGVCGQRKPKTEFEVSKPRGYSDEPYRRTRCNACRNAYRRNATRRKAYPQAVNADFFR